ncbi:class I SAM-dependent methyltransferase [Polynucleobacter paneuropaeus]|jgi:SAM-dependent methyltransferase|nr:class I SAM-dependent methyltransferase [Polynucleobacter paneuropaeus]
MAKLTHDRIIVDVGSYYSEKLQQFGETPKGVDWNSETSQSLRFSKLLGLIGDETSFSINDLGCGYGSLYPFLYSMYSSFEYIGYDISADMIAAATARHANFTNAAFHKSEHINNRADYCVASGIFNVRLSYADGDWWEYIKSALDEMNKYSKKGFSFNCLTSYSDPEKMRDYLFYADPCKLFDYCKKKYSLNVALLHDYGLYEFTIIVRKNI